MPQRSIRQRIADLDRRLSSAERYVALKLEVRTYEGERLFTVGGCWDTQAQRYVDRECETRVFVLQKSQELFGRSLATQLKKRIAGDDDRWGVILMLSERGGGKTTALALIVVVIMLALVASWQQVVSIYTAQNEEVRQAMHKVGSPSWFRDDSNPTQPFIECVNGSRCNWMTSRTPAKIRQAQINWEHVGINEGQDQAEKVYVNAQGAIRNEGGFVSIAANSSQSDAGDWVILLHQLLEADQRDGISIPLPAHLNEAVNQKALSRNERLIRGVNPEAADADSRGVIKLSGTVGYQGFTRLPRIVDERGRWASGHIAEVPTPVYDTSGRQIAGWVDETRRITAEHLRSDEGTDYVGGGDFQTDPGCCAPVAKLYRDLRTGELLLYVVEFIGTTGTEADLTMALTSCGYFPGRFDYEGRPAASLLLVGDATGARQNAEHRKRDPYSFTRLRADGWHVLPPAFHGPQRTPWNPLIDASRLQMKALLSTGKIIFSPKCAEPANGFPSLLDSLQRAKVNANGKFLKDRNDRYTHGPDGVRYLAWRFMPRNATPAPVSDGATADELRRIRVFDAG